MTVNTPCLPSIANFPVSITFVLSKNDFLTFSTWLSIYCCGDSDELYLDSPIPSHIEESMAPRGACDSGTAAAIVLFGPLSESSSFHPTGKRTEKWYSRRTPL